MGTAKKKHQPTTAPALGPKALRAYEDTPPASGNRAPSAPNVAASGTDAMTSSSHDSRLAGPAMRAARPGRLITPVPSTAPTVSADPCSIVSDPVRTGACVVVTGTSLRRRVAHSTEPPATM